MQCNFHWILWELIFLHLLELKFILKGDFILFPWQIPDSSHTSYIHSAITHKTIYLFKCFSTINFLEVLT